MNLVAVSCALQVSVPDVFVYATPGTAVPLATTYDTENANADEPDVTSTGIETLFVSLSVAPEISSTGGYATWNGLTATRGRSSSSSTTITVCL